MNEIGGRMYEMSQLSSFLCPSPDYVLQLEGKYTSDTFLYWRLGITKCNPALDPTRPCASAEEMQKVKIGNSFRINFYFMNGIVNSGDL